MPKKFIQSESIGELADGKVGRMLNKAIDQVVADIEDRGADGKDRKVILTLTFTPNQKKNRRVSIDAQIQVKAPAMQPYATEADIDTKGGGILFHDESADNPDQSTLSDHYPNED